MPAAAPAAATPATPVPLAPAEERAWRALALAMIRVPRMLEAELEEEHRLTMAEYFVLVNLSEEPDRALRITELAERGALSLSGMSRVVDRLSRNGFVERVKCPSDARGLLAVLTDAGLDKLRSAYATHLRGVRHHVMDHLQGVDLGALADALERFAGDTRTGCGPTA